MKPIVVGYDGSDAAERALARAADLAEALSAGLVVVSVSRSRRVPVTAPLLEPAGPVLVPGGVTGPIAPGGTLGLPPVPEPEPEAAPEPRELAEHRLERARMSLARRRVEAEYVAEFGSPAERLLEVAEERDASLIVVGSREHGLLERLLARPVEQQVARRSERDVLLVH
jgi:nucleotide-binding universal stress UspA family protein